MQVQLHQSQKGKNGCYGKNIQVSQSQIPLELPLRSLDYDLQILDSLAALTIIQTYHNNSEKTLDVQYIFPINPKAAIKDFQVSFDGHFIKGQIKSQEQANREYKENVQAGRAAAYADTSAISKDMMRLKIGNVAPNKEIKIKMTLVSEVLVSYNTFYEYRLATSITPRYALNINRENILFDRSEHGRSMEGKCRWSLKIVVKSMKKLEKFYSSTHKINSEAKHKSKDGYNSYEIEVTEPNMVPDKDFSLCYTFENFQKPSVLLSNSDSNTSAMVSFIPKFCSLSLNDAENHAKNGLQFPVDLDKAKGEYIFLLDRSGSMGGPRIQKAKQSLKIFLKSLPQDSFFNVLSFGSSFRLLFPNSARNEINHINKAIEQIEVMKANMGGTEILDAIKQIIELPLNEGYPRQLFLLTDGSVDNTNSVIRYVGQHTQYSRIHCIGIGNGCSEALIDGCAQMGKGYKTYISDQEEPSTKIIEILEKSLSPVISKIKLNFSDKSQVESIVPNPEKLPYILKNDLCNFYISFKGKLKKPIALEIEYEDTNNKKWNTTIELDGNSQVECPHVTTMANFKVVNALNNLLKSGAPQQDHIYFVKQIDKKELEKEVIRESINRQILTDLTAFICIDTQTPDNVGQEAKERLKENVRIQPMNPQGHMLFVEAYREESSFSLDYQDECCIQTFQMPPERKQQPQVKEQKLITKTATKQLIFLVADEGFLNKPIEIPGIKLLESHKRKSINQLALIQNPDGKWEQQFEIVDKIHSFKEYETLKNKIMAELPNISINYIVTFLILKWLVNRSQTSAPAYNLIIKKANNFITRGGQLDTLDRIYRTEYVV